MQDVLRPGIEAPSTPKAPKLMGRFRCESLLHGEGMLETWRARVQGLAGFDRMFAVKCLIPGALSRRPRAAEDLLLSARAVATLKDTRFAAVIDSGLAPGSAFVATELIHGVSLRALREYVYGRASEDGGRPATWPALLLHLGAEIAAALGAAHGPPGWLVHGALAAGSVMVTPQGGIKVLDLGLFASVHTPAEIAASPVRRPCAAPELSRGEAPTAAADMYALGALMFELATGRERRTPDMDDPGPSWSRVLAAEQQALVRQLLSFESSERPTALQTESVLREGVAVFGALDVRGELGQLVRRAMQASGGHPEQPATAISDERGGEEPVEQAAPGAVDFPIEPSFPDEPTQVLMVSEDGNPTKLAGILRDMRRAGEDEEGTVIEGPRRLATPHFPTPPAGSPIFSAEGDEAPARAAAVKRVGDEDQDPGFESMETRIQGIPYAELTDVTTGEITLGLEDALAARAALANPRPAVDAPIHAEPQPTPVDERPVPPAIDPGTESSPAAHAPGAIQFVEFSSDMAAGSRHLTPSGWRPAGDLEDATETDHVPLHDEIIGRGRGEPSGGRRRIRLGRVVLTALAMAALAAGVAVAIRFVASRPPATVPAQVQSAAR